MNTNALKTFAQEARNKLREQIAAKLDFILKGDTAKLRGKESTISELRRLCLIEGTQSVIERVTYTWFNRFLALRFMDINGYYPFHVKVVTPKEGESIPEILSNAKAADFNDELFTKQRKEEIIHVLDNPTGNPENEAYRLLLVSACNYLSELFPFLFEGINDYTELLLPNDLTSPHSILVDVVKGITEEHCSEVELIGWVYQFYISERKDEVTAAKGKVAKKDIPAITQLFTPRWIVEYMVQNTLGKIWLQNFPNSNLKEIMPYYIETKQESDFLRISSPEELTLVDPACGSGHILVYAFELLTYIYEEEGYRQRDIARLIIENNLFGYEIDERAGQLANLALFLKARSYDKGFFRRGCSSPNIWTFEDLNISSGELTNFFLKLQLDPSKELEDDLEWMREATNLGSLYQPKATEIELKHFLTVLEKNTCKTLFTNIGHLTKMKYIINQLLLLKKTYLTIVANPPYLGGGDFNKPLKKYIDKAYPDSKSDLCTCFIERGLDLITQSAFLGMITQQSWMFLGSYNKLREKIVQETYINSLLHLGSRTFPEIGGEVVQNSAFVLLNDRVHRKGVYFRLIDFKHTDKKANKTLEAIKNPNCGWYYTTNQANFKSIPGCNIGYWVSEKVISIFEESEVLINTMDVRQGLATGNNDKFMRFWSEVNFYKMGLQISSIEDSILSRKKWFPYNKGGAARKWYGNQEFVLNFDEEAQKKLSNQGNHLPSKRFYFQESISWGLITSNIPSFRYYPAGFLFDVAGMSVFGGSKKQRTELLGALNTNLYNNIGKIINPTLNLQAGNVAQFPYDDVGNEIVEELVLQNISISKAEWDSRETSWDFKNNELIVKGKELIEEAYQAYQTFWTEQFYTLHRNEETLNKEFIEIYGLEEELNPEVPLEQITILKDEASIINGELVFNAKEVMMQLISYGVGCLMGRYSLDKEGLILANQGETLANYYAKVGKSPNEVKLQPDADGIIPVLEDDVFENDLNRQFETFLRASFGVARLHDNLNYILGCLGRSSLGEYFAKDFYKDHIKRYKKRPIYWMLSSPKGAFRVLMYLHRYTPDTLNKVLNNYLHPYIQKLESEIELQEELFIATSGAKKTTTGKRISELKIKLEECEGYSKELYKLAVDRITLDLDDGVLVNYNKLGPAMEVVKGLNDKKMKDKVRKFDWVNAKDIR